MLCARVVLWCYAKTLVCALNVNEFFECFMVENSCVLVEGLNKRQLSIFSVQSKWRSISNCCSPLCCCSIQSFMIVSNALKGSVQRSKCSNGSFSQEKLQERQLWCDRNKVPSGIKVKEGAESQGGGSQRSKLFFRPSVAVSRIGLMESRLHRCHGGPPPPLAGKPPRDGWLGALGLCAD